jgi:hypothetical protein
MPKYDGWLHMSESIEFALFFRFRSEYYFHWRSEIFSREA